MSKLRLYPLLLSGLAAAGASATGVQPLQKTLPMRDASAQQTMMTRPASSRKEKAHKDDVFPTVNAPPLQS